MTGGFKEVRGTDGKLLFRYDPVERKLELKPKKGDVIVIDMLLVELKAREDNCYIQVADNPKKQ